IGSGRLILTEHTTVKLGKIFPSGFKIRNKAIGKNPKIQVARVTSKLLREITEGLKTSTHGTSDLKDQQSLLSQQFVSWVVTELAGKNKLKAKAQDRDSTANQSSTGRSAANLGSGHRVWRKCVELIETHHTITPTPDGMSATRTIFDRQTATDMENMWHGDIYVRIRDYTIKIILRLALRPRKEAHGRKIRKRWQREKEKRQKLAVALGFDSEGGRQKKWKSRNVALVNKLDGKLQILEDGDGVDEYLIKDKIQKLLHLIRQHQERRPEESDEQLRPAKLHSQPVDDEGSDSEEEEEDDDVLSEISGADYDSDFDSDSDEEGDEEEETAEDKKARLAEPSVKKMFRLETVSRKLLEDPMTVPVTRKHVIEILHKSSEYSTIEIDAVVKLCRQLRPFTPKRGEDGKLPKHVLTCSPFVLLGNFILKAAGYGHFTRRISPISSCGKSHPFPINPTSLYNGLCSSREKQFDVMGSNGHIISSGAMVCNKEMDYINKRTIRIQGRAITPDLGYVHHHTVCTSHYQDEQKKRRKTKGAGQGDIDYWKNESSERQIPSEYAAAYANRYDANEALLKADLAMANKKRLPALRDKRDVELSLNAIKKQLAVQADLVKMLDEKEEENENCWNEQDVARERQAGPVNQTQALNAAEEEVKRLTALDMAKFGELRVAQARLNPLQDACDSLRSLVKEAKSGGYYWRKYGEVAGSGASGSTSSSGSASTSMSGKELPASALAANTTQGSTSIQNSVPITEPVPNDTSKSNSKRRRVPSSGLTVSTDAQAQAETVLPATEPVSYGSKRTKTSAETTSSSLTPSSAVTSVKSAALSMVEPTIRRLGMQARVETVSLAQLRSDITTEEVSGVKIKLNLFGGDPGVCTMLTGVASTESQMNDIVQGYFSPDGPAATILEEYPSQSTKKALLDKMRILGPIKTHAKLIHIVSGRQKAARTRERRLKSERNEHVQDALESISCTNIQFCHKIQEIAEANIHRRNSRSILGTFNDTMAKVMKNVEIQATRGFEALCAERRAIIRATVDDFSEGDLDHCGLCSACGSYHLAESIGGKLVFPRMCPRTSKSITLMFIGTAGSGVNSRTKGHLRYGGNKLSAEHMRHVPVLMTDEFLSTQLCPFCLRRIQYAKSRPAEGKGLKSVHGCVQCTYSRCLSFKLGYCKRGRDMNAAFNILIRGWSQLNSETRQVLDAFAKNRRSPVPNPYVRQYDEEMDDEGWESYEE
ncbi:hypothetical protein BGZ83_002301, partial [Gryganskiella cystojenkinii]